METIIDFCYLRLKVLYEQLSKPKSNIERLVDNACGYNETEEIRKECITLGEDFVRDVCFLNELKRNG